MNWEEVKAWLEENKADQNVKGYINQEADAPSVDDVKKIAEEDKDVKSWLDGEKDRHHSKALETWKSNHLQKMVDEEVKKQTEKEPWEIEMDKIKGELEREKNEKTRETLKNKAFSVAQEKKIPSELVEYFLGEDEDSTVKNLELFEEKVQPMIQTKVDERLEDSSYEPPAGGGKNGGSGENFMDAIRSQQVKRN